MIGILPRAWQTFWKESNHVCTLFPSFFTEPSLAPLQALYSLLLPQLGPWSATSDTHTSCAAAPPMWPTPECAVLWLCKHAGWDGGGKHVVYVQCRGSRRMLGSHHWCQRIWRWQGYGIGQWVVSLCLYFCVWHWYCHLVSESHLAPLNQPSLQALYKTLSPRPSLLATHTQAKTAHGPPHLATIQASTHLQVIEVVCQEHSSATASDVPGPAWA